jgi:hypothetical protein
MSAIPRGIPDAISANLKKNFRLADRRQSDHNMALYEMAPALYLDGRATAIDEEIDAVPALW